MLVRLSTASWCHVLSAKVGFNWLFKWEKGSCCVAHACTHTGSACTKKCTRFSLNQLERFCSMSAWASSLPGQISEGKVAQRSLSSVPRFKGDTRCLVHGWCASSWMRCSFQKCCPMELLRAGSSWAAFLRNACWWTWHSFNKDFLYWSQLGFIDHELVTDVNKSRQNSKARWRWAGHLSCRRIFMLKTLYSSSSGDCRVKITENGGSFTFPVGIPGLPGGAVSHTRRNPAGIACVGPCKAATRMTNSSVPLWEGWKMKWWWRSVLLRPRRNKGESAAGTC